MPVTWFTPSYATATLTVGVKPKLQVIWAIAAAAIGVGLVIASRM